MARLILVRDGDGAARTLEDALASAGHHVVAVVESGHDAIRAALAAHPELVLFDVRFRDPGSPIDLEATIPEHVDTPVVFVATRAHQMNGDRLTRRCALVVEPAREEELWSAIELALLRHGIDLALRDLEEAGCARTRALNDGVVVVDRRGRVRFVNPIAERLIGSRSTNALGRNIESVLRLKDGLPGRRPHADSVAGGSGPPAGVGQEGCGVLVRSEDEEVAVQLGSAQVTDGQGCAVGTVFVLRDLACRRTAPLADRLAAFDAVIAGVARELDDPLASNVAGLSFAIADVTLLAADAERGLGEGFPGLAAIALRCDRLGNARRDLRRRTGRPRYAGRRPRVLVVDDEELIGRALHRLLERDHEVVVLQSARQAIELLETNASFDVIFCDLMMPELTGMDLYAWVVRHRPNLASRMLFISGGAFTPESQAFIEEWSDRQIEKPFRPQDIFAHLAAILAKQEGRG